MFSVTVCDHILIAHSLRGEVFGPAQRLHGATFAVEAEFRAPKLDPAGIVVDIGLAQAELRRVLAPLDYSNLDENPALAGANSTAEYMAFHIHKTLAAGCREGRLGAAGRTLSGLRLLLRESPTAWAAYEGPVA
jgi:6-pyruvoyl-tetrahydropterin synthase